MQKDTDTRGRIHRVLSSSVIAGVVPCLLLLAVDRAAYAQSDAEPPDVVSGSCLAAGCHSDLSRGKVVHEVVAEESCDVCHENSANEHRFEMMDPIGDVCLACHDDPADLGGYVHGPVAEGRCTACHDPHRSEHASLLREESPALCWQCHGRPQDRGDGRRAVLNIKKVLDEAEVVHEAVDYGCDSCHGAHASDSERLFNDTYPARAYAEGYEGAYELCFQCHEESEVLGEDASSTGFRDLETNLHRVHVAREKSRRCTFCHSPHGGGPHLTRKTVPFGKWDLPIGFTVTETGGTCTTACHEVRGYQKEIPEEALPDSPERSGK